MRTLIEILDAAKDGNMPTHEECYWAMLALDALHHFDSKSLMELAHEKPTPFNEPKYQSEESFRRCKTALNKSPKDWVGWNNDPANPAYQRMRKIAFGLLDKVTGEE